MVALQFPNFASFLVVLEFVVTGESLAAPRANVIFYLEMYCTVVDAVVALLLRSTEHSGTRRTSYYSLGC